VDRSIALVASEVRAQRPAGEQHPVVLNARLRERRRPVDRDASLKVPREHAPAEWRTPRLGDQLLADGGAQRPAARDEVDPVGPLVAAVRLGGDANRVDRRRDQLAFLGQALEPLVGAAASDEEVVEDAAEKVVEEAHGR
jgi:hypothetical protein